MEDVSGIASSRKGSVWTVSFFIDLIIFQKTATTKADKVRVVHHGELSCNRGNFRTGAVFLFFHPSQRSDFSCVQTLLPRQRVFCSEYWLISRAHWVISAFRIRGEFTSGHEGAARHTIELICFCFIVCLPQLGVGCPSKLVSIRNNRNSNRN